VIGNAGSGKTTFARALAQQLRVPHIELDALFWQPGWVETPPDEFKQRVSAALPPGGWVADGNYRSKLGTYVLDQADRVVWLDLRLPTAFWRVLRRTVRRVRTRERIWGTNVEPWREAFFSRKSLLWWLLKTHRRWRRQLPELLAAYPHVRLRSSQDVERYLRGAV
jgi:adenylate kinase family enzyme